ncbi:hypothetical protein KEM48_006195 [Puccinia striiformis f. sp. tritici PST-130]|nr:hypothetical protein KEM48_006195 [Puccinia striiformis f. sp. tritici PST-130]
MTFTNRNLGLNRFDGHRDVLLASSSTSLLKVVKCSLVIQINLECLRLTTQASTAPSNVFKPPTSCYTMNIFSPVSEASFPTLHEDIIAS